jgi:single-stranded DNA-specific DHH superfamily exonuclease
MLPKNPGQWERIDHFLMSFSPEEKIAIIHDADPDGLCSAVLMNRLITRLRGKPAHAHFVPPRGIKNTVAPEVFKELKKKGITKAIFTDLGVHEDAATIRKLEKQCELLIIDHHTFFHDVTSTRTVLAMPQLLADDIEPSRYSSTKLAYDLANRHADFSDADWIAAIGVISDMTGEAWQEFLMHVFSRHNLKPNPKEWFATDIGRISGMFHAAMSINEKKIGTCFDALMRATQPSDVLKNKKLATLKSSFDREIVAWIAKMPKLAEKNEARKVLWYEISPKYHINSPVSTILSLKYPDWVVLIVEKDKGIARISARCQSQRVHVNELMKATTKGLKNAGGGGHKPAAGAHVRNADLATLKQRIFAMLSKNLYMSDENQ